MAGPPEGPRGDLERRQGNPVARIPLRFRFNLVDPTGIEPVTS